MTVSHQVESKLKSVFSPWDYHLLILQLTNVSYVKARRDSAMPRKFVSIGKLFFFPARSRFSVELDNEIECLHMHIHADVMNEVMADFNATSTVNNLEPINGECDELLEQLIIEAWRVNEQVSIRSAIYSNKLAKIISSRLIWRIHSRSYEEIEGGLSNRVLRSIKEFIEARLSQNITLEELSKLAHCSLSHFSRKFKIATGQTPYQYILHKRIERSKRLLRFSSQPIAEISLECGFSHQEHLTHAFRRFTDMTPARYRRLTQGYESIKNKN